MDRFNDRMLVGQKAVAAYLGVEVGAVKACREGPDPLPVFAHCGAACAIPRDLMEWTERRVRQYRPDQVQVVVSGGVSIWRTGGFVSIDNPRHQSITKEHVRLLSQALSGSGPFAPQRKRGRVKRSVAGGAR